jgi:hypothetical protein
MLPGEESESLPVLSRNDSGETNENYHAFSFNDIATRMAPEYDSSSSLSSVENGIIGAGKPTSQSTDRITLTWRNLNVFISPEMSTRQRCCSYFGRDGKTPSTKHILKNGMFSTEAAQRGGGPVPHKLKVKVRPPISAALMYIMYSIISMHGSSLEMQHLENQTLRHYSLRIIRRLRTTLSTSSVTIICIV